MPGRSKAFTFVTTFVLLAVCAVAQQSVSEVYERARLLDESNHNLAEAIRLYSQVVNQAGDQRALAAKAQYRIGVLYERLGRKADAQRAFELVVSRYPDQAGLAQRAQAKIPRNHKDESSGAARLRLSYPRRVNELQSSYCYRQWLKQHPEIVRDFGPPKVVKFVSIHEQPFKGGLIVYNVTDGWSVILLSRGDVGGTYRKLPNPKNLTPGIGEVDEDVFAEITKEMAVEERHFYRSLVDSRLQTKGRTGIGIIGGIASLYIINKAYESLGPPVENERLFPDVVYASSKGYEVLAGLRHSIGEIGPGQPKSVYVLYADNTYRKHIVFPARGNF